MVGEKYVTVGPVLSKNKPVIQQDTLRKRVTQFECDKICYPNIFGYFLADNVVLERF